MTDYADDTTITEITIQPDGRVFIFGTSRHVIDMMADLDPRSARLRRLLEEVRAQEDAASPKASISNRRD
jgi:hypothetical protein